MMTTTNERTVLLLTYGEPPAPAFLPQLRYSWRILLGLTRSVAPIPAPVLPIIALKRGQLRRDVWTRERYGSPLERITEAQCRALAEALAETQPETRWVVRPAYEFRDPLLLDAVAARPDGSAIDIVPMYVASSAFTHELSQRLIEARRGSLGRRRVRVLPPLPEAELAAILVDHVNAELARRGARTGPDWALLLAAHGTLLDPPRRYETGREATERLRDLVARGLAGRFGAVTGGWLNHVYGGRWTEPPADQALAQLAQKGFRKVVYFPFGFLADNAESELEGRQVLETQPGIEALHLACLNESPALARLIAAQILGRVPLQAAV